MAEPMHKNKATLISTSRFPFILLVIALLVGSAFRLIPVSSSQERLLQQWPTEDGYLMLTIARNMALGHGMSTANGTMATNGTQPLATWVYSQVFRFVEGDKTKGVFWVLVLQWLIATIAAVSMYYLLHSVLSPWPQAKLSAATGASLWYVSTIYISHSMNCLESGLWMLAVMASLGAWYLLMVRDDTYGSRLRWRKATVVGLILGIATWVRIDAVFVIGAITASHVLGQVIGDSWRWPSIRVALVESIIIGMVAVLLVAPWLISNKLNFGSFIPISGTSQSTGMGFGANALLLPGKLFEYAYMVFGIPNAIEKSIVVQGMAFIGLLCWLAGLPRLTRKANADQRLMILAGVLMSMAYICYYGFFFGAAHFLARYLLPVGIFITGISSIYLVVLISRFWTTRRSRSRYLCLAVLGAVLISVAGQNVRVYLKALPHQHWQVVQWAQENVSAESWVGATQTGTLGYYHDRTINLDGKVNPEAMAARLQNRIPEYVVDSSISYLIDWAGLSAWAKIPPLSEHFELIVNDKKINLAVLKRSSLP
jgi:hypothetical protein